MLPLTLSDCYAPKCDPHAPWPCNPGGGAANRAGTRQPVPLAAAALTGTGSSLLLHHCCALLKKLVMGRALFCRSANAAAASELPLPLPPRAFLLRPACIARSSICFWDSCNRGGATETSGSQWTTLLHNARLKINTGTNAATTAGR